MYNEEVKYHMQNLVHGEESLHVDMDIKNIFKENTISGEEIAYESCWTLAPWKSHTLLNP